MRNNLYYLKYLKYIYKNIKCSCLLKGNFNTNNVVDMSFMFNECSSLKDLNISNFNTNNVKNMK